MSYTLESSKVGSRSLLDLNTAVSKTGVKNMPNFSNTEVRMSHFIADGIYRLDVSNATLLEDLVITIYPDNPGTRYPYIESAKGIFELSGTINGVSRVIKSDGSSEGTWYDVEGNITMSAYGITFNNNHSTGHTDERTITFAISAGTTYSNMVLKYKDKYNLSSDLTLWSFTTNDACLITNTAFGTLDNNAYSITNILNTTNFSAFKTGITVSTGATFEIYATYNSTSTVAISPLTSTMGIYVTSQTGTQHRWYSLSVISATCNVSGKIIRYNTVDTAMAGVKITSSYGDYTTLSDGLYTLYATKDQNFATVPTKARYRFNPTNYSYSPITSDQTLQNYIGIFRNIIIGTVVGASNVLITLTGDDSQSMTISPGEYYSFIVDELGNYTITPSKTYFSFNPPERIFNILNSDYNNQNFTAIPDTHYIDGHIKIAASNGLPLAGVTLTCGDKTTTTDINGYYIFSSLNDGITYTVTPIKDQYLFTPTNAVFITNIANQTQDFIANYKTYNIKVVINNTQSLLNELGVSINPGSGDPSKITAANEDCIFIVKALHPYIFTPTKTNFIFTPSSIALNNIIQDRTITFDAAAYYQATLTTYLVTGNVVSQLTDVIINYRYTGMTYDNAINTNSNGSYVIDNIPGGSTLTITGTKNGYSTTKTDTNPNPIAYTNINADINNIKFYFVSGAVVTHKIYGYVKNNSMDGVDSVIIHFSNSDSAATAATDVNGYYEIFVIDNYSGLITPEKTGFTFTPASYSLNNIITDTQVDFTASVTTRQISGHIIKHLDNSYLSGVNIALQGSYSETNTATTDVNGEYITNPIPEGSSFEVVPTLTDYTFTPGKYIFTNLSINSFLTGRDFVAYHTPMLMILTCSLDSVTNSAAVITATLNYNAIDDSGDNVLAKGICYNTTGAPTIINGSITNEGTGIGNNAFTRTLQNLTANTLYYARAYATNSAGTAYSNTITFTTFQNTYTVTGAIIWNALTPVTTIISRDTPVSSQSTTTVYSFVVNYGTSLVITPTCGTYNFSPSSKSFTNVTSNQVQDFTALVKKVSIGGNIKYQGTNLNSVTVVLTGVGGSTCTTDINGMYAFNSLDAPFTGRVTVSKTNYVFCLRDASVEKNYVDFTSIITDQILNFDAYDLTYNITGHTTKYGSGDALNNVNIAVTGDALSSRDTDINGYYELLNQNTFKNITLTPSRNNYTFNPSSYNFSSIKNNYTQNFIGTVNTYNVSGYIKDEEGAFLTSATVSVNTNPATTYTTTNTGYYIFALPGDVGYTITATKSNRISDPESIVITTLNGNLTNQNFILYPDHNTITGAATLNGSNFTGVTIALTGDATSSMITGSNGYSFSVLTLGNYFLTPSKTGYTFAPSSKTISRITSGVVQNFVASVIQHAVSGTVTYNNIALFGATITCSSNLGSTTTDINGNYSINLTEGSTCTVTCALAGYTFVPNPGNITNITSATVMNFVATKELYTITGTCKNDFNTPLQGVSVTCHNDTLGTSILTTTTDVNGYYSFSNNSSLNTYTVSASLIYYTFLQPSVTKLLITANQVINFTASPTPAYISGNIKYKSNNNIYLEGGVTVNLTGSATDIINIINGDSAYSFNINEGGNYTVTPVKVGYMFTPTNQSWSTLVGNKTQDFLIEVAPTMYVIEGTVTYNSSGLSGITIILTGASTGTCITDINGHYSFSVPEHLDYTITAPSTHATYIFTPSSYSITNITSNQTKNFVASLKEIIISGKITIDSTIPPTRPCNFSELGAGMLGVTVANNGNNSSTTTTDINGNYSFTISPGSSCSIIPSKTGYFFVDYGNHINSGYGNLNLMESHTNINFIGNLEAVTVAGYTSEISGTRITGTSMYFQNETRYISDTSLNTTTDGNGYYSMVLNATETYSCTPSKAGFTFVTQYMHPTKDNITLNWVGYRNTPDVTNVAATSLSMTSVRLNGTVSANSNNISAVWFEYGLTTNLGSVINATPYTVTGQNVSVSADITVPTAGTYYFRVAATNIGGTSYGSPLLTFVISETRTITGKITKGGVGVGGVTVSLSGDSTPSTSTDNAGDYIFTVLLNSTHVITPSKTYYTFTCTPPGTPNVTNIQTNQIRNFTGAISTHRIYGNTGAASIDLTLNSSSITSDANGNYSSLQVEDGNNYTLTPITVGYTFSPTSQTFYNLSSDQIQNFTSTLYNIYIGGYIRGYTQDIDVRNLLVSLSSTANGSQTYTVQFAGSNYTVYYYFVNIKARDTYTISMPVYAGYSFSPSTRSEFITTEAFTFPDFICKHAVNTLSSLTTSPSTLTFNGSDAYNVSVDNATSSITVTATMTESHASINISVGGVSYGTTSGSASSAIALTAGTTTVVTITVTAQDGGTKFYTINIARPADTVSITATTNVAGTSITVDSVTTQIVNDSYTFSNLIKNTSHSIVATKTNYNFISNLNANSNSYSFANMSTNQSIAFTGTLITWKVSGSTGIAGTTVTITNIVYTSSTTSGVGGAYEFPSVPQGGNYSVSAAQTGYSVSPGLLAVNNLSANSTGNNFTLTLRTHRVTVRLKNTSTNNWMTGGVRLTYSGSNTTATITSATYQATWETVPYGSAVTADVSSNIIGYVSTAATGTVPDDDTLELIINMTPTTKTISGTITKNSSALSGVYMALTGSLSQNTTTAANGTYSFTVSIYGTYTITPTLANHSFNPAGPSFSSISSNMTQDFIASSVSTTCAIAGVVSNNTSGYSVNIQVDGVTKQSVMNGAYNFSIDKAPTANGQTLAPNISDTTHDYTFTPASYEIITNVLDEISGKNFSLSSIYRHISGTVSLITGGALTGFAMNINIGYLGNSMYSVNTDGSGNYIFTGLSISSVYYIVASYTDTYKLISNQSTYYYYMAGSTNVTGANFIAYPWCTINGYVKKLNGTSLTEAYTNTSVTIKVTPTYGSIASYSVNTIYDAYFSFIAANKQMAYNDRVDLSISKIGGYIFLQYIKKSTSIRDIIGGSWYNIDYFITTDNRYFPDYVMSWGQISDKPGLTLYGGATTTLEFTQTGWTAGILFIICNMSTGDKVRFDTQSDGTNIITVIGGVQYGSVCAYSDTNTLLDYKSNYIFNGPTVWSTGDSDWNFHAPIFD